MGWVPGKEHLGRTPRERPPVSRTKLFVTAGRPHTLLSEHSRSPRHLHPQHPAHPPWPALLHRCQVGRTASFLLGHFLGHGDLLHAWSPSRTFCKCLLNIYYTPSPGGRGGEEGPQPHSPLPWSWHSCCGNRWQTQALRVRGCSVLQGAEIRQGRKTGSAGGRFTPMGLAEVPLQVAQEWRTRLASPSTHSESHTQEGKARRGTETHTGSLSSWL